MNRRKKNRMKFIMLVMFIFPLVVSAKSSGEIKELSLPSEGISAMKLDCGAGFLKLRGVEGLDEIKVKADIILGNKSGDSLQELIEKNVELSLERHGEKALLISKIRPSSFSLFSMTNKNSRIDLTVEVPRKMNLEIKDGSGDVELKNIDGYIAISDGSGDIEINGVGGGLEIDDGSGSLMVTDIDGNVRIRDGSGSIHVDGVGKDPDIVESGSGGVQFKDVKGKVSGNL